MPVFLAESTMPLLEKMAQDLAATRDPWTRHWLVLPGSGRSEWLQRRWARIAGIAAHSQIIPLRSVIEQVAAAEGEPFSRQRLVLAVAQALPAVARRMPLPIHTDCSVVNSPVLAWAEQVADAIDMGLLCRSAAIRFNRAPFLNEIVQHPSVHDALTAHLGMLAPDGYAAAARRWVAGWAQRGGLPQLWIQLDAGIPQVILRCLADLIDLIPAQLHLTLLSPSLNFWGDLRLRRHWQDGEDAGPVLTHLGRLAQDLHNQSIDRFLSEGSGGHALASADSTESLLGRLQRACRDAATPSEKLRFSPADWSFTVHACRSPMRELEICRDRILQAMSEDPTLAFDDIRVLLATPAIHGPLVGAALLPLPVRIAGVGGTAQSPVGTALLRLLATLNSRIGISDLMELIEEPLIAKRFELNEHSAEVIAWLEQAQFRWGLDARQRAEHQGDDETRWCLAFALRRLGLGAVVGSDSRDGVVDGSAPLERATGLSIAQLARITELATALFEARNAYFGAVLPGGNTAVKSIQHWSQLLTEWCDRFIAEGDAIATEHRTQLINAIIPSLVAAAPDDLLFEGNAIVRLLEDAIESLTSSQGSSGGGINVADLRHHAGTPARMIVVVGLGYETFPEREERPTWHPLSENRDAGDPDRREADRHALLLALLGANERLVLIYPGGSDEDAKERPPATPVADLLSAVDCVALCDDGAAPSTRVLLRHGLNGFSPSACSLTTASVGRSFQPHDYAAAALLSPNRPEYRGLWSQALPATGTSLPISLKALTDLVQEPCRIFVRRLGLRLPEELEEPEQSDSLEPNALSRWTLRSRLLNARLLGEDPMAVRVRAFAAGELPRGRYGEAIWQQVLTELPLVDGTNLAPLTESFELTLRQRTILVTLPLGWYRDLDNRLIYCTASTRNSTRLLAAQIALLCIRLTEGATSAETWFSKDKKPQKLFIPSRDTAEELLQGLVKLHELAECLPLPFWPEPYRVMRSLEDRARRQPDLGTSPDQMLLAAWSVWQHGGPTRAVPPASRSPATRACFRGLDDPFAWTPEVNLDGLAEPGSPLAWRLFRFFSQWERAAGGEP